MEDLTVVFTALPKLVHMSPHSTEKKGEAKRLIESDLNLWERFEPRLLVVKVQTRGLDQNEPT
jgi:hypothetical protein